MTELLPVLHGEPVEAEIISGGFFILEANPFRRSENRLIDGLPLDARLSDYVDRAREELPPAVWDHLEVSIGEQVVTPDYWRLVRPKPEHLVYVRVRPQGRTAKNVLRAVLMMAIVVAATAFFGPIGGFIASVVGPLIVNALIPAPGLTMEPNNRDPRYQLTGSSNRYVPYGRIPRVMGTIRLYPMLAGQPYTEVVGNDQYLRMLLVVGWGPLQISDIKIGDTAITSFPGAQVEVTEGGPAGWGGNSTIRLYNRDVTETALNIETLYNVPSSLQTTPLNTVEIGLDISFPQGLIEWTKKSNKKARTVDHRVEYRAVGSGTWLYPSWEPDYSGRLLSNGVMRATGTTQDAYRLTGRWKVPAGQYEVRVTRLTTAGVQDESPQIDQSYLSAFRSFADSPAVLQDGLCMIAVRLKASDQLNGVPDRINCIATSYLPTTTNGTTWTYQTTRNPAWAYADLLRRRAGETYLPDHRIDLAAIMAWATACDATAPNASEPRWTFDAVLEGGSVFDNLRQVAAIGRAAFTVKDGLYSVVRDVAQATPVQHITPRNSWGYAGSKLFTDLPHAFKVEFQNRNEGYRVDERFVYADGYDENNATRFEVLQLLGATSPTLVFREARYHLAVAALRPEEHYVSMDIEALRCVVGSRVELSHDAIVVGTGFGRITALSTSGANTIGLTLDSPVTFETGKTYQIRVRHADGTSSIRTVTSPGGALGEFDAVVLVAEPTASGPAVGDLFMFGETGLVTSPMLVKRIEPGDDLSCRLTLIQYDPAIYTADTGTIPAFTSYMTQLPSDQPPSAPVVVLRSDDTAFDVASDGSIKVRLAIDIRPGASSRTGTLGYEVQIRTYDATDPGIEDWSDAGAWPVSTSTVWVNDVRIGGVHYVRVRARGNNDLYSGWTTVGPHTIIGKAVPPAQPSGVSLTPGYRAITVAWTDPEDLDLDFVEVWAATTNNFASASLVGKSSTGAFTHANLAATSLQWYYWLVSVDTSENAAASLYAGTATAYSIADYEGIGDDGTLTPQEKLLVIREYAVLTGEEASLVAAAATVGVSSTAYSAAIDALQAYLTGLSPAWNNIYLPTTIVRATWDAAWNAVYTAKAALQNDIDEATPAPANANRVPFSRMEGDQGWGLNYNPSALDVSVDYGTTSGMRFARISVTGAVKDNVVSLGHANSSVPAFPLTPSSRVSVQARLELTGVATDPWRLALFGFTAAGAQSELASVGGSGLRALTDAAMKMFVDVPSNIVGGRLEFYAEAGGSGSFTMSLAEPMVTEASAGQVRHPSFSPGPNSADGADVTANSQRSIVPQFPSIEVKQGEAGHTGNRTVTHTAYRGTASITGGTWSLTSENLGTGDATINSSTGTVTLSGIVQSGAYGIRYTHTDGFQTDLSVNVTYVPTATGVVSARTGATTSSTGVGNDDNWNQVISLTLNNCPAGRLFFNNYGIGTGNSLGLVSGTGTCDHEARLKVNGTVVDTEAAQNTVTGGAISSIDFSGLFDGVYTVPSGTVTVSVEMRRTSGSGTISSMSNSLDCTVIAT